MSGIQVDQEGIRGQTVRRTLHFFWLVDGSYSMSGQKIQAVNHAIRTVLPEIQQVEEQERVDILMRAIWFAEQARWHIGPDPVPVKQFVWKDMDARGSSTSTAQALELLGEELSLERIGRRCVPPVAILLSDGYCTDPEERYNRAIAHLDQLPWGRKAVRIAIGIGQHGDYNKAQLDQFISPYLRREGGLETLPAPDVRRLIEHIRLVSTQAASASAASRSDLSHLDQAPVQLDPVALTALEDGPQAPDYGALDPNEVF